MFKYFLKRFVFLIPTVFFISIVTFFVSINAPGDPVEIILLKNNHRLNATQYQNEYKKLKAQLGLDLPLFYFTLKAPYTPNNLYTFPISHQEFIEQISFETKNMHTGVYVYTFIMNEFIANISSMSLLIVCNDDPLLLFSLFHIK